MNKLTSEQMAWAMRRAANYLEQHGEEDTALESLRYYADMTEKHGKDSTASKGVSVHVCDGEIVAVTAPDNDTGHGYRKFL